MKRLATFILAISFVTCALSQVHMFPQVGLNFTQFETDPDSLESEYRLGYNLGVDFRMGDKGIFQPGFHFYKIQTDLKTKEELQNEESFADEISVNLFKVPANLGFFVVNNDDFKVWVTGGVGFWIPFSKTSQDQLFDIDDLRPFFMSGNGSAHFQFWNIALSFQYDQGFSQVHNRISNSTSKTMGVSLGYAL